MTGADFDAGYWEDRYRRGDATSGSAPSPSLVEEAGGLVPGSALDAGCGRGADAVWLAGRGWRVTALDVSATALARASEAARDAGVADVEWLQADLTGWDPGGRRFDLVTSHYVHVPGPVQELVRRLASWVAPGGTLLFVGHDAADGHGHAHPAGAQVELDAVQAALPTDGWDVVVAERRTHEVARPDGAGTVQLSDVVVRARRTGPGRSAG